ncbi:hypothetical protein QF033_003357 [Bacillus pumilus]|nr:hypothetical protein [Bacillus pumilus]
MRKNKIQAMPPDDIVPFREAVKQGWKSIFIFFGALIPIIITIGPLANYLKSNPNIGPEAMDQISLITWIPIPMMLISLTIGRKKVSALDWSKFFKSAIPKFTTIGALMLFAVAASQVLAKLGLAEDLTQITSVLAIPKRLMVLIVGVLVTLVANHYLQLPY